MNKKVLILIFALIIVSTLFLKVRSTLPTVRAEGHTLSWQDFSVHKAGLMRFRDLSREKIDDREIEAGVIASFVEDALVKKELESLGRGEDDVRRIISADIENKDLGNLEEATNQLYGWSMADFEKFILYPQARKILLLQEFEKEKIDPAVWLENSLDDARISVYLWRWKWGGEGVVERF